MHSVNDRREVWGLGVGGWGRALPPLKGCEMSRASDVMSRVLSSFFLSPSLALSRPHPPSLPPLFYIPLSGAERGALINTTTSAMYTA